MIQLSRNYSLPEQQDDTIRIKVIGVGGAGSNALDRIVLDGLEKADLLAVNTDAQSLASSVAAHKVQIGRTVTRGLGAGGDPELGYNAVVEAADELRQSLSDARMVLVCAGLGGGTGSGAAPVIAELARENGAMVISFATLPFAFEGKRRTAQALEALARLHENSDAVICFENDRMGDIVAPKAGIHQAFAAADVTISQSVRSIVNLLQRPGLIRIGFDDLLSALRNPNGRCLFGFGESDTDNRAHDALTQALKSPLLDRGRLLADATNILVQVAGGPGMTLSEVEILMQELGRHINDHTQILFGTSVDNRMGNKLAVTLISSLPADGEVIQPTVPQKRKAKPQPAPEPALPPVLETEPTPAAQQSAEEIVPPDPIEQPLQMVEAAFPEPDFHSDPAIPTEEAIPSEMELQTAEAIPPTVEPEPAPPRVILPQKKPVPVKVPKAPVEKIVHAKQELMQFESVTRGRFEKSEPTIVEGQDLDVPTFLRKNVRVK